MTIRMKKEHLQEVLSDPMNENIRDLYSDDVIRRLEKSEDSVTVFINDKVYLCGGITEVWKGRGLIWTVFNQRCKRNFVPVFRAIEVWLAEMARSYRRIEVCVPYNFEIGKRRAHLLGFKLETERAEKFFSSGEDASIFVMVGENV